MTVEELCKNTDFNMLYLSAMQNCHYNTNVQNKKALPVEYSVLVVNNVRARLTVYTSWVFRTNLNEI